MNQQPALDSRLTLSYLIYLHLVKKTKAELGTVPSRTHIFEAFQEFERENELAVPLNSVDKSQQGKQNIINKLRLENLINQSGKDLTVRGMNLLKRLEEYSDSWFCKIVAVQLYEDGSIAHAEVKTQI